MADGQLATTNEDQNMTSSPHSDDVTVLSAQVSEVLKVKGGGAAETGDAEKAPSSTGAAVEASEQATAAKHQTVDEKEEHKSADVSADNTAQKTAETEQITEAPAATIQPNSATTDVTIQDSSEGQSSSVQEGAISIDQGSETAAAAAAAAAAAGAAKETKEDAAEADKTKTKETETGAEEPKKAKSSKEKKSGFCKTS